MKPNQCLGICRLLSCCFGIIDFLAGAGAGKPIDFGFVLHNSDQRNHYCTFALAIGKYYESSGTCKW